MAKRKSRVVVWVRGIIGTFCLVLMAALPATAINECKTDLDAHFEQTEGSRQKAVGSVTECEADLNAHFESELIALINVQRGKNGLQSLAPQPQLKAAARAHSADMACNGLSSHAGSDGSSTRDRLSATGYPFQALGENIAAGYDMPHEVVTEWMNSSKHRRIILDPSFTEIGAGYAYHSKSRYGSYWTALFGCRSK